MTDGQLSQLREWMAAYQKALLKVKEGSEKYILFAGVVMTLGAVLTMFDVSGPNGTNMTPYYQNFDTILREIRGFGVTVDRDLLQG